MPQGLPMAGGVGTGGEVGVDVVHGCTESVQTISERLEQVAADQHVVGSESVTLPKPPSLVGSLAMAGFAEASGASAGIDHESPTAPGTPLPR